VAITAWGTKGQQPTSLNMKKVKNISAFTLLELIISLALGLLIVSMLIQFYLQEQDQNRYEMQLSRMLENASLATHVLHDEIQNAGYVGCPRFSNSLSITNNLPGFEFTPDNIIKGIHDDALDSDQIIIRRASERTTSLLEDGTGSILIAEGAPLYQTNDALLISDCKSLELFQVSGLSKSSSRQLLTTKQALANNYSKGAEISSIIFEKYFVRGLPYKDKQGDTLYGLYREDLITHHIQPLVDGIEKMKITYGIAVKRNDELEYKPAEQVANWQDVIVVHIDLMITSLEGVKHTKHSASDHLLRKEWPIDIAIQARV